MIAKHVRIRQPKAGRFARLVQYLLDPQEKLERVGKLTATNCYSDDPERAVLEVMNTQAQNVRAKSEKTYHLVVSFPPGENPSEKALAAIEKALVEGLGYQEHQRVSVVHHDTDHLHIHIAINKIHPHRLTIHEPIRDYYTLGTLCEALEKQHGLQKTNHQSQAQKLQQGAAEMETRSHRESLATWAKRECAPALSAAASWEEWHGLAAKLGLTTRRRANGLVFEAADGIAVKASSVDRAFSLTALEKRFGAFMPAAAAAEKPTSEYRPNPVQPRGAELYARYQLERAQHADVLKKHRERLREAKRVAIQQAKRLNSERRRRLRALPRSFGKQLLYREIARAHRARLDQIFAQATATQQLVTKTYGGLTWADWLARESTKGDVDALSALRGRVRAQSQQNSVSAGAAAATPPAPNGLNTFQSVTKRGTIFVRPGIRDEGHRVSIQSNRDIHDYVALLGVAASRFGPQLRADGDQRFRTQIVLAAVVGRLNVTFEDAALEAKRQQLTGLMEKLNERRDLVRRGADRGGARPARGATSGAAREFRETRNHTAATLGNTLAGTDIVGHRPVPTAESIDRLRTLSALPVVGDGHRAPMLLPRDVHHHLGQQRPETIDTVRRPSAPTLAAPEPGAWEQADRYIAERMEKRSRIADIPKHERHEGTGLFPFAGLRTVNGQALALFKTEQGVSVMPVSDYAAKRLKDVALSNPVEVTAKGVRLGRSR